MVLVGQALDLRPLEAGSGESIFEVRRLGAVKVIDVVEQFVARLPPVGTASASALEGDAPAGHGTRAGPAVAGCVAPRGAGGRKTGRARLCHVRTALVVRKSLVKLNMDTSTPVASHLSLLKILHFTTCRLRAQRPSNRSVEGKGGE